MKNILSENNEHTLFIESMSHNFRLPLKDISQILLTPLEMIYIVNPIYIKRGKHKVKTTLLNLLCFVNFPGLLKFLMFNDFIKNDFVIKTKGISSNRLLLYHNMTGNIDTDLYCTFLEYYSIY